MVSAIIIGESEENLFVVQPGEFTVLLQRSTSGDKQALDTLMPVVYAELRKLAASSMRRERSGHTLQPTALIHEAYLQLVQQHLPDFESRAHFLAVAARIMRQLLIASARRHRTQKRGGGASEVEADMPLSAPQAEELLAVDEALDALAVQDERKAKVMELKHFGGLNREEIAVAMGLTLPTVKRDISLAEAWLRRMLSGRPNGE
jgi:RNA polymerase sigma-70 factor (ECF subfamily)